MARRRKGRNVSGWVVVNKPAGVTSTDVVGRVRWAFAARKAGHAGTLDPDATGVLAVALGEATKTIPYVTEALKSYDFVVRFGQSTQTDDAEGAVISASAERPTDAAIADALGSFLGEIFQVPPKFSAVKVNGERAYDLAREGEDFKLKARLLWVEELFMLDRINEDEAMLRLVCGKGGYVRAIARDLGEKLGCLGHVRRLHRSWSGPFSDRDAWALDKFDRKAEDGSLDVFLKPLEEGLVGLPRLSCRARDAVLLRNGNPGEVTGSTPGYGDMCWAACDGRAVAVGRYKSGYLHPVRVFLPSDPSGAFDAKSA